MAVEENLAGLRGEVEDVRDGVHRVESLLITAIACKAERAEVAALSESKADKSDFDDLRKLLIGIIVSVAGAAILIVVGILLTQAGLK